MLRMKKIFKEAHKMTKEIVEKYNDVDYQAQFALCLQYLIEESKKVKYNDDDLINFTTWYNEVYLQEPKLFGYLYHKNDILVKNGKITESQLEEFRTTTATYSILNGEEEDVKQEVLLHVMEAFERNGGSIRYGYTFNTYVLCVHNAIRKHVRMIKRSRRSMNPNEPMPVGFNDKQEQVAITDDRREISYLKMDIEKLYNDGILTKRQLRIIQLIEQGFNQIEIADIVGISRQYVYKERQKIKQLMIDHGLVVGY